MGRELAPYFDAACRSGEIEPVLLVFLDILEDPVRAWTGPGRLWCNGHWWEGVGALGTLEPIEETTDLRAGVVRATILNVPSRALSDVPALTWKGRRAEIDLALIDTTADIIGTEPFFRGWMDTLTIKRGGESSTIEVSLVNDLLILKRTWGSAYTAESHRAIYPEDTALRFVPYIQDHKISY